MLACFTQSSRSSFGTVVPGSAGARCGGTGGGVLGSRGGVARGLAAAAVFSGVLLGHGSLGHGGVEAAEQRPRAWSSTAAGASWPPSSSLVGSAAPFAQPDHLIFSAGFASDGGSIASVGSLDTLGDA